MTLAEPSTWIKLNRNISRWHWYTDGNTMRVFIHLLLTANVKPGTFMGKRINRGETATSMSTMSEALGMSKSQVRTALNHLRETEEITIVRYSKFAVIKIIKYEQYQSDKPVVKKPRQQRKEPEKKTTSSTAPAQADDHYRPKYWEINIPEHYHGKFSQEEDWLDYVEKNRSEVEQWVTN